jgi:hypothetical protein
MSKTYKTNIRRSRQSRKIKKSIKNRKMSRTGGFFKMPTKESLKQSMAKGAALADKHYKEGVAAATASAKPHIVRANVQSKKKLEQVNVQAKQKLAQVNVQAKQKLAQVNVQAKKKLAQVNVQANVQAKSIYNKAKYISPTNFVVAKAAESMYNKGVKHIKPRFNQTLEAAKRSQMGVPQSNFQYGGPGVIATKNSTIPSQ